MALPVKQETKNTTPRLADDGRIVSIRLAEALQFGGKVATVITAGEAVFSWHRVGVVVQFSGAQRTILVPIGRIVNIEVEL